MIIFILFHNLNAGDFKLNKIIDGFESPWSLTFIDSQNLLVRKAWKYKILNLKEK